MKNWLCVVQREHALRGVSLGIVQTNHGAAAGLRRMGPGDGLLIYSPKTSHPVGERLREFTAIGRVADGEPWQAHEGERHPWRRKADWLDAARPTPIEPLLGRLDLTRGTADWGLVLRRGLLEITSRDFALVAVEMDAEVLLD